MSSSHNRWIVSAHSFYEHGSFEVAAAELERLAKRHPDKTFWIYRIKNVVDAPSAEAIARALQLIPAEIA